MKNEEDIKGVFVIYKGLHIILHYITLHSLDPKLVKMTVGCGISYTNIISKNGIIAVTLFVAKVLSRQTAGKMFRFDSDI
jgi:hypothetical protein